MPVSAEHCGRSPRLRNFSAKTMWPNTWSQNFVLTCEGIFCLFLGLMGKLPLWCIKGGGALSNPCRGLGGAPVGSSFSSSATDEAESPWGTQAAPCHHKLFALIVELKLLSSSDSSSLYALFQHSYRQYEHSEDVKGFFSVFPSFLQAVDPRQSAKNPSSSQHCWPKLRFFFDLVPRTEALLPCGF